MTSQMILSVDDDDDILRLFATLFHRSGYGFQPVSDPTTAHEKILQTSPDLITIDLNMPEFDGFSLISLLRSSSLTSSIPLIVVSGLDEPDTVERVMKLGVDDIIQKPFKPLALLAKVKSHIEKKAQKDQTRLMVERYINPHIAKKIFSDENKEDIGNRRMRIAVLFADIRGFTYLASLLEPEDVFHVLNTLLDAYSQTIMSLGGTIDKFIGDGVMAFWGAPLPNPEKEVLAVEAALAIMEATRQFNEKRTIPGGLEIQVGIGINCGVALVGAVGGQHRKDYTAIGEVVNLAARFESIAKPGDILIGEEMNKKVRGQFSVAFYGHKELQGVLDPVKVYKVIS